MKDQGRRLPASGGELRALTVLTRVEDSKAKVPSAVLNGMGTPW